MLVAVFAAIGALSATANSAAQNAPKIISDADILERPTINDVAKYTPSELKGASGLATIRCVQSSAGRLELCEVADESPSGRGFGAAALKLAPLFKMREGMPKASLGHPEYVQLTVHFGETPRTTRPGAVITNPDWLKKPTAQEVEAFWPAAALTHGVSGRVVIDCAITLRGLLEDCRVASESPTNYGFGDAALMMSTLFLMHPAKVDGVSVSGARVTIPLNFKTGSGGPTSSIRVVENPPWDAAPTATQVAAAFPKIEIGKTPFGHVNLRCRTWSDRSLRDCTVVAEEPPGHGFAGAARGLIGDFKIADDTIAQSSGTVYVDIPFDFRDPTGQSAPVEVADPQWLVTPDPKMAGKVFPDEAFKAGYKTGLATVGCEVAHSGKLVNCAVSSESPAGLGFGIAALAIADVMVMNPWTRQGSPVDGARISLPIRVNLGAEPTAADKPR